MTKQLAKNEGKWINWHVPFREICHNFVDYCKLNFEPNDFVTVDEQLVSFKGIFNQFIQSKPGKYGIKIWAHADVKITYLHNLQAYTGKLPDQRAETNQANRVVTDLVTPIFNSGRSVTTDNR